MTPTVLIIDDEPTLREALGLFIRNCGFEAIEAGDGKTGIERYERDRPDVVILDLGLPGLSGLQVLEILRARDPDATVLILTALGDVQVVVRAMQLGAEHFLTKPLQPELLRETVLRAMEKARLHRRSRDTAPATDTPSDELRALREHPTTARLADEVEVLAAGQAPVLLQGETGTGKGWTAHLLHALSPRAMAPFVEINCAGLSATFLESELFGHEKGAFTDAKTQKAGLFEVAAGGTLFLDEVGDLAPELQPKLLKALESKTFRRLGGTREIAADVRFIAATNRGLAAAVEAGRFRKDLYYRLAVLPIHLPALRERGKEAIVALATRFVAASGARTAISARALTLLASYSWPGNVRELRNVLERATLLAGMAGEIGPAHLPDEIRQGTADAVASLDGLSLSDVERRHVQRVLALHGHNRARAARALGITRVTLYKKIRDYGLEAGGLEGPEVVTRTRRLSRSS